MKAAEAFDPSLPPMTPETIWRIWIQEIVKDPDMDRKRIIAHVRKHILKHMPDEKDSPERWSEWLAGAYNLFAILGTMQGIDPSHEAGVDLLYRKWLKSPFDYTKPPVKTVRKKVEDHDRTIQTSGS